MLLDSLEEDSEAPACLHIPLPHRLVRGNGEHARIAARKQGTPDQAMDISTMNVAARHASLRRDSRNMNERMLIIDMNRACLSPSSSRRMSFSPFEDIVPAESLFDMDACTFGFLSLCCILQLVL